MKLKLSFILLLILFSSANTAFAYIDPGSSSIILTYLIGILVAVGTFFKLVWSKIKSYASILINKLTKIFK